MATLSPGSRIGAFPYEVVWQLDAEPESQGQVYLAKLVAPAPGQASYVVVKLAGELASVMPLTQEVEQLSQLKHPGIVRIFPLSTTLPDQHLYLAQATTLKKQPWFSVREYLAGGSLTELMAERELDLGTALEIGRELATTLDYIHSRRQVHAAIHPCHVLLRARPVPGKPVQPVLIGFGRGGQHPQREQRRSLAYSAPEARPLPAEKTTAAALFQPASDIYSLGVLLYEMLTGHLPYSPHALQQPDKTGLTTLPPSRHNTAINQRLDTLILQMISPVSHERPSAAEVVTRLEAIAVQDGYLRHYPSGINDTVQSLFARRRIGQRRLRLGVIGLGVLVALQWLWLLNGYFGWF